MSAKPILPASDPRSLVHQAAQFHAAPAAAAPRAAEQKSREERIREAVEKRMQDLKELFDVDPAKELKKETLEGCRKTLLNIIKLINYEEYVRYEAENDLFEQSPYTVDAIWNLVNLIVRVGPSEDFRPPKSKKPETLIDQLRGPTDEKERLYRSYEALMSRYDRLYRL
jgi:hypothetical protein